MKLLKLILIFALLVGGIIFAMNIGSIFSGGDEEKWGEIDKIDVTEKCAEIRSTWESQPAWDAELYQALRDDIDQSREMQLFTREGYGTVNNTLRETSVNKAVIAYLNEINCKEGFSHKALLDHYKGVQEVKQLEKLTNEKRIADVEAIHSLYTKVNSFVGSKHTLTPNFNGSTGRWTSFDAARQSVLTTARNYRSNALFKQMSSVPGFEAGLSEAALIKTLDPQRNSYYDKLSRQIIDNFSKLESNEENYKAFVDAYNRYANESTRNLDELAKFKLSYKPESE